MTTRLGRSLGTVLVAGTLVAGLAACGGNAEESGASTAKGSSATTGSAGSSGAAPSGASKVSGNRVDLELNDQAVRALTRAGISWRADAPASRDDGDELRLPVTGGSVSYDPLAGSVSTEGVAVASKGGRQARVSDVTVDLTGKKITGAVAGTKTTLATLDTDTVEVEHESGPVTDVDGIDVTFTAATVRALNRGLGTDLPTTGMTAELELHLVS